MQKEKRENEVIHMNIRNYKYIIVGAGLAGASAVEGIRSIDKSGTILVIGDERHLPYNRPPLTKQLWTGKKKLEEIFVHDQAYYNANGTTLELQTTVLGIDRERKLVVSEKGEKYQYQKLLLATGGIPRPLTIPGGNLPQIYYYRYLDDYLKIRAEEPQKKSVIIIGGGFIGSELAAAMTVNGFAVTMVFPEKYIADRIFPLRLKGALQKMFQDRGIRILNGERPASLERSGEKFIVKTERGAQAESDLLVVGIGIAPETKLAAAAGLQIGNGIVVNEYLQSSDPDIYAAGDNAFFHYQALDKMMRVEHWDNALNQGQYAGRNMAGSRDPYTYMPYFFSDLFEFGYEAVGEINSDLEIFEDWTKENDTGAIYYMREGQVRGVMLCNIWGKMEDARRLILDRKRFDPGDLRGKIKK